MSPRDRFPHPANAALLAHLEKKPGPAKTEYRLEGYELHAHPDLMDHLYPLNPCCKASAYGYPVLAGAGGIIFAVAMGTSFLAFRLGEDERPKGGTPFPEAGPGWAAVDPWRTEAKTLSALCRAAHAAAVAGSGQKRRGPIR